MKCRFDEMRFPGRQKPESCDKLPKKFGKLSNRQSFFYGRLEKTALKNSPSGFLNLEAA